MRPLGVFPGDRDPALAVVRDMRRLLRRFAFDARHGGDEELLEDADSAPWPTSRGRWDRSRTSSRTSGGGDGVPRLQYPERV